MKAEVIANDGDVKRSLCRIDLDDHGHQFAVYRQTVLVANLDGGLLVDALLRVRCEDCVHGQSCPPPVDGHDGLPEFDFESDHFEHSDDLCLDDVLVRGHVLDVHSCDDGDGCFDWEVIEICFALPMTMRMSGKERMDKINTQSVPMLLPLGDQKDSQSQLDSRMTSLQRKAEKLRNVNRVARFSRQLIERKHFSEMTSFELRPSQTLGDKSLREDVFCVPSQRTIAVCFDLIFWFGFWCNLLFPRCLWK